MKKYTFIAIMLCLFGQQLPAQWALGFNGGEDYVLLNGTDFPPPWTMEVKINKNKTDNYQHLLTSTDGNSGIRNEQWWGTQVGLVYIKTPFLSTDLQQVKVVLR